MKKRLRKEHRLWVWLHLLTFNYGVTTALLLIEAPYIVALGVVSFVSIFLDFERMIAPTRKKHPHNRLVISACIGAGFTIFGELITRTFTTNQVSEPRPITQLVLCYGFCALWAYGITVALRKCYRELGYNV